MPPDDGNALLDVEAEVVEAVLGGANGERLGVTTLGEGGTVGDVGLVDSMLAEGDHNARADVDGETERAGAGVLVAVGVAGTSALL
jgi:hypothetical protein